MQGSCASPDAKRPALTAPAERARDAAIADCYLDLCRKVAAAGLTAAEAEAELADTARAQGWDSNAIAWATRLNHDEVRLWAQRVGLAA